MRTLPGYLSDLRVVPLQVLCTLWQYDLLCHIWNILVASSLSLVVCNLLLCVQICYSCNTWVCVLVHYSVVVLFLLVCLFLHRLFLNLSCSYSRYWSTHILVLLLWLSPSIVLDFLGLELVNIVTNFIRPYLHQFFGDSYVFNGTQKPLKRPFNWYQSHLEAISNGRDIRQINW